MFSELDLRWGYHQIELSEGSREITAFIAHNGLHRYKRLMLGMSSAPEKYQQVIQQTLKGIEGVHNISDDIIVHGATHDQHDERLSFHSHLMLLYCSISLGSLADSVNFPVQ